MELLFGNPTSWLGIIGTVGLTLAGYLAQRYVIPFLKIGHRQKYAQYIGAIADDLTDELRAKYPGRDWLAHLDEAVDRLIEICGVTQEIARRALRASAARK
jgi:hypothetical protein